MTSQRQSSRDSSWYEGKLTTSSGQFNPSSSKEEEEEVHYIPSSDDDSPRPSGYTEIQENMYTFEIDPIEDYDEDDNGNCEVNYGTNMECNLGCGCDNHNFQTGEKRTKVMQTADRGFGLFADEDIEEGEFIIEYKGEVITGEERNKRLNKMGTNKTYIMDMGIYSIDAANFGNNARFANHSCRPNAKTEEWYVKGLPCMGLFAKRDLKKGEEITFDYKMIVYGENKIQCKCREGCTTMLCSKKK